MTVGDLAHSFSEEMFDMGNRVKAAGFRIGKGKKLYWYIDPTLYGMYRCIPLEADHSLGWPRYVTPDQEVTVVLLPNQSNK